MRNLTVEQERMLTSIRRYLNIAGTIGERLWSRIWDNYAQRIDGTATAWLNWQPVNQVDRSMWMAELSKLLGQFIDSPQKLSMSPFLYKLMYLKDRIDESLGLESSPRSMLAATPEETQDSSAEKA